MNKTQVKELIQRWRHTPEDDLRSEDYQHFRNLGSACLAEGDTDRLLTFLQDEKNQGIVKSMGFLLLEPLVNEVAKKEKKSVDRCQAAILHLTRTCRPPDLLHSSLQLIEGVHAGVISETVLALMPHLQTVLQQLQEERAASLGLVLAALQRQLSRLPVPYTLQQEQEDGYGLCRCCGALAAFVRPFVEQVKERGGKGGLTAEDEELRMELVKFCMRSLREPLLGATLHPGRKSPLWLFAVEIMVTLPAIREPCSGLLFFSRVRTDSLLDHSQSRQARASLAYLLFVQLITIESFPAVFSPVFVLQCNMEHVDELTSSKKESHLQKGLALLERSLEKVPDHSLPVSLLALSSFYSVPQNLRLLLTDCPMQHLRTSGLRVFQLFIHKLDAEAKHKFFRCMLKTSKHVGLESVIVKNIRNQVERSMKLEHSGDCFLGTDLLSLLRLVLCLPQGPETDLLSNMDRIMESLNLLRFLLIRDKELRRDTAVWDELIRVKDQYLIMLRVCISMSRSYYSAELKALREDRKQKAKESRDAARSSRLVKSLSVTQEQVSNMPPEVQHQVLQCALVTFDLMESLVIRIEEITEEKAKLN
ncbi:glomulin-like [Salarias fasciatus]|uniref:glomulin-like n=1 Tax=Salarias fasciatus TaxID=181472 RepID=UPI001176CCF1|nr:glomulin-like [Salarias fasciatus]